MSVKMTPPTHRLVIEIPLDLTDVETFDYEPLKDALQVVLSVSRLQVDHVLCGLVDVALREIVPSGTTT